MRKRHLLWLVLLTAIAAFATAGLAADTAAEKKGSEDEKDWMFHDIVDIEFVKRHVTVPMEDGVMLIDSRPKQGKYDKGHIPMAVNIPDTYFEKMKDKLPRDKDALLIFYCEGPGCKLSHKSARKAEALGYRNVKVYAEGYPGWMKDPKHYPSISVDYQKKLIDAKTDMMLIDSRPKRTKYDKGHIPGAVSLPDGEFDKSRDRLPEDREKLLVFYCEGPKCKLSHASAGKAIDLGYKNVMVFTDGYPAWKEAFGEEKQVAGGNTAAPVKRGKEEGSIDPAEFEKIVKENPEQIMLVDTRDADEYLKGTIRTAVNIPVDKLDEKIPALPADKPIVFICGTGARSGESYYMVQDKRPELKNVYYLEAELTFKKDGSFVVAKGK